MIIFAVGILLIVYGLLSKKKFSVWIGMAFVLLIMGFQEGVPGDYDEYKYMYQTFSPANSTIKEMEYSYIWVIQNLPTFMNFHIFVFFSSLLQCLAMGYLIKKYANNRYQFYGILVLFFTFSIMMLQMKAMRQAYAIDTILFALILLDKRKYIFSALMLAIAYGFHNSSLIAIAFYVVLLSLLIFQRNKRKNRSFVERRKNVIAIVATSALFVVYVMRFHLLNTYIDSILLGVEVSEGYDFYLMQMDETKFIAWWQMLYYLIATYAVTLYICSERAIFKIFMGITLLVGYYVAVFVTGSGNLQRISAYFIIFSIVVLPNTVEFIHKNYGRHKALAFIVLNMLAIMRVTVPYMFSYDFSNGTGFGTYTFSFLK